MLDKSCQNGRAPLSEHPDDCYDSPAVAVHALMRVERLPKLIWEPACGTGNIVTVLRGAGHDVLASDINNRGCERAIVADFLKPSPLKFPAIVTNPPYVLAAEFVTIALERAPLVIMLLRLAFLESIRRTPILDKGKLARVHAFANRLPMMHRDGWTGKRASSAVPFAWFVWDAKHNGAATVDRITWEDQK
jgi:hypothetical protein